METKICKYCNEILPIDYSKQNKLKIDYDNVIEINQQIEKCNRIINYYSKLLTEYPNRHILQRLNTDDKRYKNKIKYQQKKKDNLIELRDLNVYFGWCYSELTRPLEDWEKGCIGGC